MTACIFCGCTEQRACVTLAGPCHWASTHPPICSKGSCVAQGLTTVIADTLERPAEEVTLNAHLFEALGGDDLDRVEISIGVEHLFEIELTDDEYAGYDTLAQLLAIVGRHVNKKRAAA